MNIVTFYKSMKFFELRLEPYFASYMYCANFGKKVWVVGEEAFPGDTSLLGSLGLYQKIHSTESQLEAYICVFKLRLKKHLSKLCLKFSSKV